MPHIVRNGRRIHYLVQGTGPVVVLLHGIIVRPLNAYQLNDFVRVTVGTAEESGVFLRGLLDVMGLDRKT